MSSTTWERLWVLSELIIGFKKCLNLYNYKFSPPSFYQSPKIMSRGHRGLICHCPFFWSRAGGKSWCPTDQSHWSLFLDLSPRWPANTIMLFVLNFRKSRTVIWRINNYRYQQIFCIQSHFRNTQFQEAGAQPPLLHWRYFSNHFPVWVTSRSRSCVMT